MGSSKIKDVNQVYTSDNVHVYPLKNLKLGEQISYTYMYIILKIVVRLARDYT